MCAFGWTNWNAPHDTFNKFYGDEISTGDLRVRWLGSHLVFEACRLMRTPHNACITGTILLQQYLYFERIPNLEASLSSNVKNFADIDKLIDIVMGSFLVACKVEECQRRIRDVVNTFHWIMHQDPWLKSPDTIGMKAKYQHLAYVSDDYYDMRDRATNAESHLLSTLGFRVQPRHAVGLAAHYLYALSFDKECSQLVINYLNDSLYSPAYILFQPNVIACAAISLAVGKQAMPLSWNLVFGANLEDVENCVKSINHVYEIWNR